MNSYYDYIFEVTDRLDSKYLKYTNEISNDDYYKNPKLGNYIKEIKSPASFEDNIEYKYFTTSKQAISDDGKFLKYNIITKQKKPSRAKQVTVENTIIVAVLNRDTSKACIINKENEGYIISSGFLILKPNDNLDINYLRMILHSNIVLNNLRYVISQGQDMACWSFNDLKKIRVNVPSLSEQQRTLPLVKEKIKTLKDKIKELEVKKEEKSLQNVINRVFEEELGITKPDKLIDRYGSFGESSIMIYAPFNEYGNFDIVSNSEFEMIDELSKKYPCKKLKEVVDYFSGGRGYAKKVDEKTDYYRIMPKDMSSKDGILDVNKLDNMSYPNYNEMIDTKIENGDIMLSVFGAGSLGKVVRNVTDINAVPVNNIVATIRAKEQYGKLFLFYYLTSYLGQQQILRCITGTTGQLSLSLVVMKNILVPDISDDLKNNIIIKIENSEGEEEYIKEIQKIQDIIDNDLNKYILNGYNEDLFRLYKEGEKVGEF